MWLFSSIILLHILIRTQLDSFFFFKSTSLEFLKFLKITQAIELFNGHSYYQILNSVNVKDYKKYSGFISWTFLYAFLLLPCSPASDVPTYTPAIPCQQLELYHCHHVGHCSNLRHVSCQLLIYCHSLPLLTVMIKSISDTLTCTSRLKGKHNPTHTAAT